MTAPLIVGIDRARVARLRGAERRTQLALAINSLVFGLLEAVLAAGFFLYMALNAPSGQFFYALAAVVIFLFGAYQLFTASLRFRLLRARSAYWAMADLSDVAFRLDVSGITVRVPPDFADFFVAWPAVRSLAIAPLDLEFLVDPGILPEICNDRIDFGLLALDTQPETIRAAALEFSGGRVGA